jgi:hypothetical protein
MGEIEARLSVDDPEKRKNRERRNNHKMQN